jgi:endonuclease G, mitochondrial
MKKAPTPYESLMRDRSIFEAVKEQIHSGEDLPRQEHVSRPELKQYVEGLPRSDVRLESEDRLPEAIILFQGRPSLLVANGTLSRIALPEWQRRLKPHVKKIERTIASVGRVELLHHADYTWVGTCFVIDERLLVTNRHVAKIFARRQGNEFVFLKNRQGVEIESRVDFREEYRVLDELEIKVDEVVFIAGDEPSAPDVAFLRLADHASLPAPLTLARNKVKRDDPVAVIGYPALDSRNDGAIMSRIFEDIYDKKRFAPGRVSLTDGTEIFQHDCSSLGGCSGSPIGNYETGEVVGLHFSGRFGVANYAFSADAIRKSLARIARTSVSVQTPEEARRTAADYEDRTGYQETFLGDGLQVPLPLPNSFSDLTIVQERARGISRHALDYTHFSIVMSESRRTALYTAVNIDGNEEVVIRRRNTGWMLDPRIEDDVQVGPDFYVNNRVDRGHLVRRMDPVWGTDAEAKQAEHDTFHYTNAAPQHELLNQREWLGLEDYILQNTNQSDIRISVFTGPVFRAEDATYRDVQIPEEFWKVVAHVGNDGGLRATAYLLSQKPFLDDLEFTFGQFRSYQTSVREIERLTGLSFGPLGDVDAWDGTEATGDRPMVRLDAVDQIVL